MFPRASYACTRNVASRPARATHSPSPYTLDAAADVEPGTTVTLKGDPASVSSSPARRTESENEPAFFGVYVAVYVPSPSSMSESRRTDLPSTSVPFRPSASAWKVAPPRVIRNP